MSFDGDEVTETETETETEEAPPREVQNGRVAGRVRSEGEPQPFSVETASDLPYKVVVSVYEWLTPSLL